LIFSFDKKVNFMETVEDLEQKLSVFKEKLSQVESGLVQSPNDEVFLNIKVHLVDVIRLTEDLLNVKRSESSMSAAVREHSNSSIQNKSMKKVISNMEGSNNINDNIFSSDNNSYDHDNNNNNSNLTNGEQISAGGLPFSPGDHCVALWKEDGNWYEAIVDSVPSEVNPYYQVTFVGYGNSSYVSNNEISYSSMNAKVNWREGLDSTFEVPDSRNSSKDSKKRSHFQSPPPPPPPSDPNEEEASNSAEHDKDFVIPKNLKILPTDSEEVRQNKRRRIHAIKSQFRKKKLEEERNVKKNAWQQFASKTSKGKPGFLSGRTKESIFKSPDTVGGKVGVTGSGKPLTPQLTFKGTDVKRENKPKINLAPSLPPETLHSS